MDLKEKKKEVIKLAIDKVSLENTWVKRPSCGLCCGDSGKKTETRYPSLFLTIDEAPSLKGKETGDEVTLLIKGKVVSHCINDNINSKDGKREDFSLEIHQMGIINE